MVDAAGASRWRSEAPPADDGQLVTETLLARRTASAAVAGRHGTARHTDLVVRTRAPANTLRVGPAGLRRRRDALATAIVGLGPTRFCRGRTKPAAAADADGSARSLTLTATRRGVVDAPLIGVGTRAAALTCRVREAPAERMAPALENTVAAWSEIASLSRERALTAALAGGIQTARYLAVTIRPVGIHGSAARDCHRWRYGKKNRVDEHRHAGIFLDGGNSDPRGARLHDA